MKHKEYLVYTGDFEALTQYGFELAPNGNYNTYDGLVKLIVYGGNKYMERGRIGHNCITNKELVTLCTMIQDGVVIKKRRE